MTKNRLKLIGERIRLAREEKGYTQARLGDSLELSEAEVHQIEQGEISGELGLILQISTLLDCSIDYLLGVEPGGLQPDEAELLNLYRTLPPGLPRDYILNFLKSWTSNKGFRQDIP